MEQLQAALEETAAGRGPGVFALVAEAGEMVFAGSVGPPVHASGLR